ncbi:hypothetical protein EP7_001817 [Isosphaeraceae bacterium EP7]
MTWMVDFEVSTRVGGDSSATRCREPVRILERRLITAEGSAFQRVAGRFSAATILGLACLAPWMFGSVDAWAEVVLDLCILVAIVLCILAGWNRGSRPNWLCGLTSLSLAGLALLAMVQAAPLPEALLKRLDSVAAENRAASVPSAQGVVI